MADAFNWLLRRISDPLGRRTYVWESAPHRRPAGCSAGRLTPQWPTDCVARRKDPQVVPGRPHCKSYKGLSSFHLFSAPDSPGW